MDELKSTRIDDAAPDVTEVAYTSDTSADNSGFRLSRKRRRSGAGCLITVLLVILICSFGFAVAISLIKPFGDTGSPVAAATAEPTVQPDSTPASDTSTSTPAPIPTQWPTAEYDGQLPVITDSSNPFPDIISGVQHGVVSVYNYEETLNFLGNTEEKLSGSGTGFVISSAGYCVTNAHVVEGAAKITLVLSDDTELPCQLVGMDKTTDIAVLKFDNSVHQLKPLCLGDSDEARVGEFVITVGDPSGRELAGTITFGIISAVNRQVNIDGRVNSYIQTDAAMNPGNSGGPLINTKGEVIGVTSAKTVTASYDEYGNAITAEGLGFAIPINTVKRIADSLITTGRIVRPGIGVTVRPATEEQLYRNNLQYGLYVSEVAKNGPAETAGIKAGDILVSCEGKELHENDDLTVLVRGANVGDKLSLWVYSDGTFKTVILTVGDLNTMG